MPPVASCGLLWPPVASCGLPWPSCLSDCSSPPGPSICYVNWRCLLSGGWCATGHGQLAVLLALPDKSLIQLRSTIIITRMSYFMLCRQAWRPTGFNSTDRSPLTTSSSVLLPVSLRWAAAPLQNSQIPSVVTLCLQRALLAVSADAGTLGGCAHADIRATTARRSISQLLEDNCPCAFTQRLR